MTALLFIFASCSEDIILTENVQSESCTINRVSASIPDFINHKEGATRTAVEGDETMSLVWAEKDTIGIFPSTGFQVAFSMAEGAGQKNATFTGGGWGLKSSSTYSAYCPMIGQFYLDKTVIPMNLNGQTQKANGSSEHVGAYDYLVAINSAVENGRVNFEFQHLVTVLRLKVTMPRAGTYTTMLLKTDGHLITEGTINLENGIVTPTKTSNQQVLNLDNIKLSDEDLVLDAYVVIVPVDLSVNNMTAEIFDNKGNCYTVDLVGLDYVAGDFYRFTRTETAKTLPLLTINTPGGAPITSKEEYITNASISIASFEEEVFNIKGRGNSTWARSDKKPYAIKFDEKMSILSLPKDKSWVLLANYFDDTLLRNDLALYMGNEMSILDWTPHFYPVELTLNGEYRGIYQVGEKVKVSKNRVNVDVGKDVGFLLEIDEKALVESDARYFNALNLPSPINIKEPEVEYDDANYSFAKDYVLSAEAALYSEDFKDVSIGWQKYMDMDSFVEWYLINEIAKNSDACRLNSSCYMNLKPGDKLKMGPLWDFDLGFGNYPDFWDAGVQATSNNPEGFYLKDHGWFVRLFQDPAFVTRVKERFNYYYENKQMIFNRINASAALLKDKVVKDNNKWETICSNTYTAEVVKTIYLEKVENLKSWLSIRLEWLNEHINGL